MGKTLRNTIFILVAATFSLSPLLRLNAKGEGNNIVPAPPKEYTKAETVSYYYLQAIRVINIYSDYELAYKCVNKALERDSTHSASYYTKANILMLMSSDQKNALKYSYKANQLEPDNVWYKEQLGRLFIMNEKYDSALVVYNDLAQLAPNNPDNYRYLAALYQQMKQPFTALSVLDSAEVKFGINEELSSLKRELLIQTGLFDKAITETKVIIENFPYEEKNYVILGELYARNRQDSLAMDAFSQAAAIDPENTDLLGTLSDYYRQKNDVPNFIATTKKILASSDIAIAPKIKIIEDLTSNIPFYRENFLGISDLINTLAIKYPDNFKVTGIYADHLLHSGEIESGLNMYKQSLQDSVRLDALYAILEVESYLNRPDSVRFYSDMAIEHFPKRPELYMRKAFALSSFNDLKGSEEAMKKALKYADSDSLRSIIYCGMANIVHRDDGKDSKKFFPLYEKALKYNPDNTLALNNYSYYLSVEGKDLDKALKMIERVMELEPSNATYIDSYGWVLYKMGRFEDAKKVLRQAVSLDATASKELLLHYGDVLYELKDYFMASVYWKKALDKGYDKEKIEKRLKLIEGK